MALLDLSAEAWALVTSSVAARASDISFMMITLSFSILLFILPSASICSLISAVASACFLLRLARMDSCWMLAASTSFLSFCTSASLFLLSSTCAVVAPLASESLSPSWSISLAMSDLCLSALALACLSASSSSSIVSTRPWISLIPFWALATRFCSSSNLAESWALFFSLLPITTSRSLLALSRSATESCAIFNSPSTFLFCFSRVALAFFSLSKPPSSSARVDSSLDLMEDKCPTFSLAAIMSSLDLAWVSPMCFFSLFSLFITSSCSAISSWSTLMVWSRLPFSSSTLEMASSMSSISFFDHANGSAVGLDLSCQSDPGRLLLAKDSLLLGKLCLSLCLEGRGLGLSVRVHRDAALLLLQLLSHGLDVLLESIQASLKGLGHVESLLVFAVARVGLFLELPELLLRVWQADGGPGLLDDDEPSPVPAGQVLPEVPLANLDQFPLVELLLVDLAPDPLEDLSLHQPDPLDHQFVPRLFHGTQGPGTEEHHRVTEPVPLTVERNPVHEGPDSGFVVGGGLDGLLAEAGVPHLEVRVEHPVGESSHADPNALEHTVTGQLVHDQRGLHLAWLLVRVRHEATHEVGLARVQGRHQVHEGHQVDRGDGLAATLLLLLALLLGSSGWLSGVVGPQKGQQNTGGSGLHNLDNSVVDRVLVLFEPPSHVVGDDAGVVGDGKVSVLVSLRLGLQEYGELAERSLQLLFKGLVGGLGEERLLLQDGPDAHGLLKHDDGSGQVHAEVNHDPVNALLHVLLLLNNKHVVVEELLQFLVHKVDGNLLKAIVLENLEAGNVEHSAEVGLLQRGVDEGVVTLVDEPLEDAVKDCSGNTTGGHGGLLAGLAFDHPLSSDLDPWLAEGLEHSLRVTSESSGCFSCKCIH